MLKNKIVIKAIALKHNERKQAIKKVQNCYFDRLVILA